MGDGWLMALVADCHENVDMNSKYTRLDLHKVTDEEGTATEKETIMEYIDRVRLNHQT